MYFSNTHFSKPHPHADPINKSKDKNYLQISKANQIMFVTYRPMNQKIELCKRLKTITLFYFIDSVHKVLMDYLFLFHIMTPS